MKIASAILILIAVVLGGFFDGHKALAAVDDGSGPAAAYGCPADVPQSYREPRVCLETQGWWIDGRTDLAAPDVSGGASDFAFSSEHVHLMIPFPLGEQFSIPTSSDTYAWPYVAQSHNAVGGKVRSVRGGGFQMGSLGCCAKDAQLGTPSFTAENMRFAGTIDDRGDWGAAWRSAAPGVYENRFTFDTTSKEGRRQYQSGAWNASLNQPGVPVAFTARGWYEGPGYTNVTMKAKAQAHTLADGSWYVPGKSVGYSLAQGATFAFAYIDANIHAGSKGAVLFENRTGSSGTFTLPALSPGDHVLLLGGWEKYTGTPRKGWNAGVMRIPFHVEGATP